jgi:hypothetical protein
VACCEQVLDMSETWGRVELHRSVRVLTCTPVCPPLARRVPRMRWVTREAISRS